MRRENKTSERRLKAKYQLDLVRALTGRSAGTVRKAMARLGLKSDTVGFCAYMSHVNGIKTNFIPPPTVSKLSS